jgi:hypothetical protein
LIGAKFLRGRRVIVEGRGSYVFHKEDHWRMISGLWINVARCEVSSKPEGRGQQGKAVRVGILKGYRIEPREACGMCLRQDATLGERDCRTGFE